MKKLITLALLTLSTFSLMAEFPVRKDNFDRFANTNHWIKDQYGLGEYKTAAHFFGKCSKINGKVVVFAYDERFNVQLYMFESENDGLVLCLKNMNDETVYFSNLCEESELTNGFVVYSFHFADSPVIVNMGKMNEGVGIVWKIWK